MTDLSLGALIGYYVTAVLAHVVYNWMGWWSKPGNRRAPFRYWSPDQYLPLVLKGAVADFVIFNLYRAGWLDPVIEKTADVLGYGGEISTRSAVVAVIMGWLADSVGKKFMELIEGGFSRAASMFSKVGSALRHKNGD